jgi:peptidyl-prolyl cis-trans isomerase D
MNKAAEVAKSAHDTIYQEENFDRYASDNKLQVHRTGFFALNDIPGELQSVNEIAQILPRLHENEISRVLQGQNTYYIVRVVARKPPYVPKLADIASEVERQYRQEKAEELAKKEADDLLSRLKKGEKMEALARSRGLRVVETGFFQPGGNIPTLGSFADITEALFQLSLKNPCPEKVYSVDENQVILRLREIRPADEGNFASQKDAIDQYLLESRKAEIFRAWLEGCKADFVREKRLKFIRDFKEL